MRYKRSFILAVFLVITLGTIWLIRVYYYYTHIGAAADPFLLATLKEHYENLRPIAIIDQDRSQTSNANNAFTLEINGERLLVPVGVSSIDFRTKEPTTLKIEYSCHEGKFLRLFAADCPERQFTGDPRSIVISIANKPILEIPSDISTLQASTVESYIGTFWISANWDSQRRIIIQRKSELSWDSTVLSLSAYTDAVAAILHDAHITNQGNADHYAAIAVHQFEAKPAESRLIDLLSIDRDCIRREHNIENLTSSILVAINRTSFTQPKSCKHFLQSGLSIYELQFGLKHSHWCVFASDRKLLWEADLHILNNPVPDEDSETMMIALFLRGKDGM